MRIAQVTPDFGLGGTQKAPNVLADELVRQGHMACVIGRAGGPRFLENPPAGLTHRVVEPNAKEIIAALCEFRPDIVHIHSNAYERDLLYGIAAAPELRGTAVASTPVFGRPPDDRKLLSFISTVNIGDYRF